MRSHQDRCPTYHSTVAAKASAAASSIATKFKAAVADEQHLDLLLEGGQVGDIRHGDAAAAEDADVGELVEIGQSDLPGLHAAHGEAGHSPIGLISDRAEAGINEGNQVVDKHPFESAEIKAATSARAPPAARTSCSS